MTKKKSGQKYGYDERTSYVIGVRVTSSQLENIRQQAEVKAESISTYARKILISEKERKDDDDD